MNGVVRHIACRCFALAPSPILTRDLALAGRALRARARVPRRSRGDRAMAGFSGAVKLGDLDDFIAPSQSCVVALNGAPRARSLARSFARSPRASRRPRSRRSFARSRPPPIPSPPPPHLARRPSLTAQAISSTSAPPSWTSRRAARCSCASAASLRATALRATALPPPPPPRGYRPPSSRPLPPLLLLLGPGQGHPQRLPRVQRLRDERGDGVARGAERRGVRRSREARA